MAVIPGSGEEKSLFEVIQTAKERFYTNKEKEHDGAWLKAQSVIIALILLNKEAQPKEIIKFIQKNINNPRLRHLMVVGDDIKSQVNYYLGQFVEKGIVEKKVQCYKLIPKVIPPWPERNIEDYLSHERQDSSFVLAYLEIIDFCIRQVREYYLGGSN